MLETFVPLQMKTSGASIHLVKGGVLATWRERADNVQGHAIPSGHFLAEEAQKKRTVHYRHFFLTVDLLSVITRQARTLPATSPMTTSTSTIQSQGTITGVSRPIGFGSLPV